MAVAALCLLCGDPQALAFSRGALQRLQWFTCSANATLGTRLV